jgi:hypothetical protein
MGETLMIERIDNYLRYFYHNPSRFVVGSAITTIILMMIYSFAPHIEDARAFFFPLLGVYRGLVIITVVILTLSLIFYAQHNPIAKTLGVFVVVGLLVGGSLMFVNNNPFKNVQHVDTVRSGRAIYHIGRVSVVHESRLVSSYAVYKCDFIGIFCEQVARDLIPTVADGNLFQYGVVAEKRDDGVIVYDGGTGEVLLDWYG